METVENLIRWAYEDPKSPACFTDAYNVLKEVRKQYPKTSIAKVKDVLQSIQAYTLHRRRRIRFPRLKTRPAGFMTDVQVDLADFQKVASQNDNFKYMLVGVDVLSRRVFAAPTKSKASNHMIAAFNRLFRQMPAIPRRIFSDKGVEFQAREVRNYLRSKEIHKLVADSPDVKAAVAERFIRTIKGRLYQYFTLNKTVRWIDVLPSLLEALNKSKSRATGMRPIDINYNNAKHVWEKVYGSNNPPQTNSRPDFEEGDKVRIAKQKLPFDKAYLPNYTNEIYEIRRVKYGHRKEPVAYDLKTRDGVPLHGNFYAQELSRVKADAQKLLTVEKVLKSRKRKNGVVEYLVKWKNLPEEEADWVTESMLKR